MDIVLWTVQGLLAAVFLGSGVMHLTRPKEVLAANPTFAWTKNVDQRGIHLIGAAEVAGAVGLILPGALNIAPALVAWAGLGLALLMAGAVYTHLRLRDAFAPALLLGLLSLFVFVGRQWVVAA